MMNDLGPTDIEVTRSGGVVQVSAPYHPGFDVRARGMGASYQPEHSLWTFENATEKRVRGLCVEVYGTDGTPTDLVTLRVRVLGAGHHLDSECWLAGRRMMWRDACDAPVQLGGGCTLVHGEFAASGGTESNPKIGRASADAVVEIRGVPRRLAEAEMRRKQGVVIVEQPVPTPANVLESISDEDLVSDEDLLAEVRRRGLTL